ncbi:hypothetical protein ACVWXM_009555 [Bradyrhizobium sp. GM7.3]
MLASRPASMVNQKRTDLGIPNRFNQTPSRFSSGSGTQQEGLGHHQDRAVGTHQTVQSEWLRAAERQGDGGVVLEIASDFRQIRNRSYPKLGKRVGITDTRVK